MIARGPIVWNPTLKRLGGPTTASSETLQTLRETCNLTAMTGFLRVHLQRQLQSPPCVSHIAANTFFRLLWNFMVLYGARLGSWWKILG